MSKRKKTNSKNKIYSNKSIVKIDNIQTPIRRNNFLFYISKKTWGLIVAISTIVSFLSFKPELSFTPLNDTSTRNAFSTQFELHNESIFSIKDIIYKCHVDSIYFGNNNRLEGINFQINQDAVPEIESKGFRTEDFKFRCLIKGTDIDTLNYANTYFIFKYKYLIFSLEKRFRVQGRLTSGRFIWTKQPDMLGDRDVWDNFTIVGRCPE